MASQLVQRTLEVIQQYDIRLTVRQIYYRLVAAGHIKNSRSSYNSLDRSLVNARLRGIIPFGTIEDRSRGFLSGDVEDWQTPEGYFKNAVETLRTLDSYYEVPFWLEQPEYVEVWVEKDALASLCNQICDKYNVRLAPCKGYPSLTFLYEASKHLANVDKPITILYFGDFDMRGKDIQRYITERLEGFGIEANVQRIALTRQQVEAYSLPPQPAKKTDTMASGWIETEGDVAWELDALEPNVLLSLIEDAVVKHLDKEALQLRNELLQKNRESVRELVQNLVGKLG